MDYWGRVIEGAHYLDEHFPEWYRRVDPLELHVGGSHGCVLCIASNSYSFALARKSLGLELIDCYRFGFYIYPCPDVLEQYEALTERWRSLISMRRSLDEGQLPFELSEGV